MSPITVVTSEDMKEKGLMSIGDVMDSLTENSGYTEGKESNLLGRFTTGGQEVNIRGLGTGRTLILLNGRRIADYPLPFGGEQNGVDVGAIPHVGAGAASNCCRPAHRRSTAPTPSAAC